MDEMDGIREVAGSQVDDERFEVRRTVTIDAPRGVVWAALTEPAQLGQWFGQRADFPQGVFVGATGTFSWDSHGDFPVRIEAYDPQHRFDFVWGTPGEPIRADNATTAHFVLEPDGERTVVSVTETGFDGMGDAARRRAAMDDNAQGWADELGDLDRYLAEVLAGRPAQADVETGTITRTVVARAPREHVWSVLVDPRQIEQWWGHPAKFPSGLRPGAPGTFEWVGHGLMPVRIQRYDAPGRFAFLWGELGAAEPGPDASLVEFTLTDAGDRTVVTVRESGFASVQGAERRARMDGNVSGWGKVLDSLVGHAEVRS